MLKTQQVEGYMMSANNKNSFLQKILFKSIVLVFIIVLFMCPLSCTVFCLTQFGSYILLVLHVLNKLAKLVLQIREDSPQAFYHLT